MNNSNFHFSDIITWVIVIGSAVLLADLAAAGVDKKLQLPPAPISAKAASAATVSKALPSDLGIILRQPPEEVKEEVKVKDKDKNSHPSTTTAVESTALNSYTLEGTIMSDYYNAAILNNNDTVTMATIGDKVEGYTVTELHPTWVTFANDTETVQILLASMQEDGSEEAYSKPIHRRRAIKRAVQEEKDQDKDKDKEKENAEVAPRLSLDDIRAQLDDTAGMASKVRVLPQARDGQPWGTRIDFKDPDNILSQMGVQNGDVLLSVNGAPTRNTEEMYQGYMTIRNADALEFVVDRNGTSETVRYELAK